MGGIRLKKYLIIFLILICLVIPISSFAKGLPAPSSDFYVYDEVGLLEDDTIDYIVSINKQLEEQTGSQVVVAVIEDLEDKEIEDYSLNLFRKWGIGDKQKNNGVLLLVSPNDKKVRIEVGYGLEGVIPDSKAGDILDSHILPYFKKEEYNSGVKDGFSAIVGYVCEEYEVELEDLDNVSTDIPILVELLIVFLILLILTSIIIVDDEDNGFSSSGGFGGGKSSSGGGGFSGGGGASGGW